MKMLGGQNEVVYAFIQQWYMAFYNEPDTILGPEIRFANLPLCKWDKLQIHVRIGSEKIMLEILLYVEFFVFDKAGETEKGHLIYEESCWIIVCREDEAHLRRQREAKGTNGFPGCLFH